MKSGLRISFLLLFFLLPFSFASASSISFHCSPYTEPFEQDGWYTPAFTGTCFYTVSPVGPMAAVALFKGTVGSAELVYSDIATTQNIEVFPMVFNDTEYGDHFFAASFSGNTFDDLLAGINYLGSGGTAPQDLDLLEWRWGTDPEPPAPVLIPLTVTADNKVMTLGGTVPTLTASYEVFENGDDASDLQGAPECTTTATPVSPIGVYPITCSVGSLSSDKYKFDEFVEGTLSIQYRWDGFLQPINDTAHQTGSNPDRSVFKGGSTVPAKLQLKDASGNIITNAPAPVWLTPQNVGAMIDSVDELYYTDPATTDGTFDLAGDHYKYNWGTKGLATGRWWKISVKLHDNTIRSVYIGLR